MDRQGLVDYAWLNFIFLVWKQNLLFLSGMLEDALDP